jgi:hypothetical protein
MRLSHWLSALVIGVVVFAVGQFAMGALAPNDWRKDLLPLPPSPVRTAASAPASVPAAVADQQQLPASAPAASDGTPTLQTIAGTVERKGRVGSWQTASIGDRFDPGSSLRATSDSGATIALGPTASIALSAGTTIQFDKEITKIWLDSGELKLQLRAGGEPIEIAAHDGKARVRGTVGVFTVQSHPNMVLVMAKDGEVELIAAGKTVALAADTMSWAAPGRPPVPAFATDHKPDLRVVEPKVAKVATPSIVIKGQTEPLTEVTVNGAPAKVDAKGGFSAVVPLEDGENSISVVAKLFTGTESRQELNPITRVKKLAAPASKKPAIKWGPGK